MGISQYRMSSALPGRGAADPDPDAQYKVLYIEGRAAAQISQGFGRVNALHSTSALGMPAIDLLAGLASQDPSGIVLIQSPNAQLAFALEHGRVVGALGTGATGSVETWCPTATALGVFDAQEGKNWISLVHAFIVRCVLDRLDIASTVGARFAVYRGDVHWLDDRLAAQDAPTISHLLLEHAREADDAAQAQKRLEPIQRIVVPEQPPSTKRESIAPAPCEDLDAECSFAGLLSEEPDGTEAKVPSDTDEARIYRLCDGTQSIEELIQSSLLGRARTLAALTQLVRSGNVRLLEPKAPPEAVNTQALRTMWPDPVQRLAQIENFMGQMPDWLAVLEDNAVRNDRKGYAQVAQAIADASYAVSATRLETIAKKAKAYALTHQGPLTDTLSDIEAQYAQVFRELLALHTL